MKASKCHKENVSLGHANFPGEVVTLPPNLTLLLTLAGLKGRRREGGGEGSERGDWEGGRRSRVKGGN